MAEIGSVQVEFDYKVNREALAKSKEERATTREVVNDTQSLFLNYSGIVKKAQVSCSTGVLQYFKEQRGYDNDTLLQWGIGFHPDSYKLLVHRYGADGRISQANQAGVIDERDNGLYDVFLAASHSRSTTTRKKLSPSPAASCLAWRKGQNI